MRRFFLISFALLLFVGVVGGTATYVMAGKAPFLPGSWLFPAQLWSEQQWGLAFNVDAAERAAVFLNLLERRLDDLEASLGTEHELIALTYLDRALDHAVTAVTAAPAETQPALQARLMALTERAIALADGIKDGEGETAVLAFIAKSQSIQLALTAPNPTAAISAIAPENERPIVADNSTVSTASGTNSLADSRMVPFPEGSVDHSFFPLSGGHAEISCETCHSGGSYQGTDTACITCHTQDDSHNGLYGADCATCHNISGWQDVNYDHSFIGDNDCAACHTPPANHYDGECRACHSDTENFANATFNHATIGGTDCAACHTAPAGHYSGACSACHSDTSNFRNATFNHATIGGTDCAACHTAPAGHYSGACTACHSDTSNFSNATFNHATIGGTDCSACHAPPANHYGGACTACHSDTSNFSNATFNHATIGGTDCSACHTPPANHYGGACSACHVDTGNFHNVNFSHNGLTDCQSCHARPSNHFAGQCSDCHNTDTWDGASFDHTFPLNHEGANGDCATCHPGGDTASYTCTACHNYAEEDAEHDEVSNYSHNCVACHANGDSPDDD